MSEDFLKDMSLFQILLNMLYERSVRTCFEGSIEKLLTSLVYATDCINDSISKDLAEHEIEEGDIKHLSKDPVLSKRF